MALRKLSRVMGSLHDMAALLELPSDDCHILFVNSQTLSLIQQFARYEVQWPARYALSFSDNGLYYEPLTENDSEYDDFIRIAENYGLEVITMASCSDLIIAAFENLTAAIDKLTAIQGSCCGTAGSQPQVVGGEGGPIPPGFGDASSIEDYKCHAANYLYDQIGATITEIKNSPFEYTLELGLNILTSLTIGVATAAVLGVFGTLLAASWLAIGALVVALIQTGVDMEQLETDWAGIGQEVVDALYSSINAENARAALVAVAASNGVSLVNQGVLYSLAYINGMNMLFFEPDGAGTEISDWPITYECASGCQEIWVTPASSGGGGDLEYVGYIDGHHVWRGNASSFNGVGDNTWRFGCKFYWNVGEDDWCGPEVALVASSQSGLTKATGVSIYRGYNQAGSITNQGDVLFSNWSDVGELVVTSATEGYVDFYFTPQ